MFNIYQYYPTANTISIHLFTHDVTLEANCFVYRITLLVKLRNDDDGNKDDETLLIPVGRLGHDSADSAAERSNRQFRLNSL